MRDSQAKARSTAGERRRPLKLCPELVPAPLWGVSAYHLLRRGGAWKRIQAEALGKSGGGCAICGLRGPPPGFLDSRLYCHEVWRYQDRRGVATLQGFQMLCAACNSVAHMGRSSASGYLRESLAHLSRVNRISEARARTIFDRAMRTWRARSRKEWTVAVSADLLARHPELCLLVGQRRVPSAPEGLEVD